MVVTLLFLTHTHIASLTDCSKVPKIAGRHKVVSVGAQGFSLLHLSWSLCTCVVHVCVPLKNSIRGLPWEGFKILHTPSFPFAVTYSCLAYKFQSLTLTL